MFKKYWELFTIYPAIVCLMIAITHSTQSIGRKPGKDMIYIPPKTYVLVENTVVDGKLLPVLLPEYGYSDEPTRLLPIADDLNEVCEQRAFIDKWDKLPFERVCLQN